MGIRKYKPTTNGRRGMSTLTKDEITTSRPEKSLLKTISKTCPLYKSDATHEKRSEEHGCGGDI